ncbi:hypothetical protein AB6B38_05125 [Glycocaulis abyssi]|uniref:DUF2007 domain-containing protein n=1 Tax=Glycocaulis abyssi TaxID=1433403 RepID=A0ABV9NBI4_9PROT
MSFVRLANPLSFNAATTMVAALNGQGIYAFMGNEHLAQMNPAYHFALGGFPIYVAEADLQAARAYLEVIDRRATERKTIEQTADDEERDAEPDCPVCGGESHPRTNWLLTILTNFAVTLTGFPVPSKRRQCVDCGHVWRPGGREPFTPEELGYDPDGPVEGDFVDSLKSTLSRIRSIGYEHMQDKQETRHEP